MDVRLRPIRPDDAAALGAAYERLSPESKRRRFLVPKPRLGGGELRYLTEVDGVDHVAWVATPGDRPHELLAVGRFVRLAERPDTAELAIVVGDRAQGRGIGRALAHRLADEARARGIRRLTAVALSDNVAVHRLLETISARVEHATHEGLDEIVLDLAA